MRRLPGIPLLALALALALPAAAYAAPARLAIEGSGLSARDGAALFDDALRAPADSARTRAALTALIQRLEGDGYLEARATARWDTAGALRLTVAVELGPRARIASLIIEAPAREDSARFAAALGVAPGDVASPARLRERIERAVDQISGDGHPYAVLGVSGWDADSGAVRVRLTGALGPRVEITDVRIEGLHATRRDVALRALGPLEGRPYSRAAAEDARDRLEALGLFQRVTFEGLEGEGDWSRAHLVYRVSEPRYNEFEGVIGMQGQSGPVGLLRLELANMLGTGRALGLRWDSRGKGVSQFGAHASEPQLFRMPLRLDLLLDQEVQDTLYVRTRWGAHGIFALSGRERVEAGFEGERVVSEHDVIEEADLSNATFAFERATLDPAPGSGRGTRVRLGGTQVFETQHLRPSGVRNERASAGDLALDWRRPLTAATGISLEVRAAGRISSQRILPQYERYPIGGASTLRGYDQDQFWVDHFALTRLEWGRVLGGGGQWAYLFWDHAWMGTRVATASGGDEMQNLSKDGLGFGLRLAAAASWVGLDYGLEPGRSPLEGKLHLRLISQF